MPYPMYHTDDLLRKHKLLVKQASDSDFSLVDWETFEPVSRAREDAFFAEEERACPK